MSNAYGNPPRGDEIRESWNNDPNNYGTQKHSSSDSTQPVSGFQPGFEDHGVSRHEGAWDNNAGPGAQWTAGHGDSLGNTGYKGNTTDHNVPGAGTGDWQQNNANGYSDRNDQSAGHPTMGQRVKGTAEKLADKMTANTGMQERGQQRRDN